MADDTLFPESEIVKSALSEKEKRRLYNQRHYQENRAKRLEDSRAYHLKNREKLTRKSRARYQANKDHHCQRSKKWHAENRDYALQKMREWGQKNGHKRLGRTRKQRYGITPQEYEAMFRAQGGLCAVCGCSSPKSKHGWHVDHNHSTGKVRSILCHNCNCGIGHAKESAVILQKMIEYLDRYARNAEDDPPA